MKIKETKKIDKNKQKLVTEKGIFTTYRIIFITIIFIFSLIFFNKFLHSEELQYSRNLQFIIYIGLIIGFLYLCLESFKKEWKKKNIYIVTIISFALIIAVYILAFDPVLDPGGDNAFYIIGAKSIASFNGYRFLNEPNAPLITFAPVLPVLLAPIIHYIGPITNFTGPKIIALKMVPFSLALLFLILCFFFFKNYLPLPIAVIITFLITTNPFIIHFSSLILTEIPFLFFSLFALQLLNKYDKNKRYINKYLFFAGLFVVVTYLTRSVGLGFLITSSLYFILKKNYKKALALAIVVFIFLIPWLFRSMGGKSQLELSMEGRGPFLKTLVDSGLIGLKIAAKVMPQNIFNYKIVNGIVFNMNIWIILVLIILILGFFWHITRKRSQIDLYVLSISLPAVVLSRGIPLEMSRYFVVLIPFLIYYFFIGLSLVVKRINRFGVNNNLSHTVILGIMSCMFFSNLLGVSNRIQIAHRNEPYTSNYTRFLETSFWAKDNTPKGSYFGVRKPTTFYVFSNRHATFYAEEGITLADSQSKETESKILELYKRKNIDYIVLDCFSSEAYQLIYPIIKNNPDKFTVVYSTKEPKTYVLKLNKWW